MLTAVKTNKVKVPKGTRFTAMKTLYEEIELS